MQQLFLLFIVSLLPFLSKGQDAATLQQLKAMGYEQVDLKALRQQQKATPCATCPHKKAIQTAQPPSITAAEELQDLKSKLPKLRQEVSDSQADPSVSAAMRQKYQTALARTLRRIQQLEQIAPPASTTK